MVSGFCWLGHRDVAPTAHAAVVSVDPAHRRLGLAVGDTRGATRHCARLCRQTGRMPEAVRGRQRWAHLGEHAESIFDECAQQENTGQRADVVLAEPQKRVGEVVKVSKNTADWWAQAGGARRHAAKPPEIDPRAQWRRLGFPDRLSTFVRANLSRAGRALPNTRTTCRQNRRAAAAVAVAARWLRAG